MKNFVNFLKNKIKVNKTFWMYRHLLQKDIWLNYYDSYSDNRRFFYSKLVSKKKFRTVFEFGSASGPNLKNIELFCSHKTFLFGFDINKKAIAFAKNKFDPKTSFFTHIITEAILNDKFKDWGIYNFDLAIYDRVLCLLSEEDVVKHFAKFSKYFSFLVIDDFHNFEFEDMNDAYKSKNYEKILSNFNFKLTVNEKSEHLISDEFFDKNARRLVFQKIPL